MSNGTDVNPHYRELDPHEKAMLATIRRKADELEALCANVRNSCDKHDPRALAIAKTELQAGIMWLTRAVAAPKGF